MKLKTLTLPARPEKTAYPFIPLIRKMEGFAFDPRITFIVGENGSGKTTFLDLVADLTGAARIGDMRTSGTAPEDLSLFRMVTTGRDLRPFYFKAEDFTLYLDYVREVERMSRSEIDRIDKSERTSCSKSLMKLPHANSLSALDGLYDHDLSSRSHGERFLDFFEGRLRRDNLYLLDEPEVPLSVTNQFVLLRILREALKRNCQFIISTHSPVLLAYPGAAIYQIGAEAFRRTTYEDLESVSLMRTFLNRPDTFMKALFREEDEAPSSEEATAREGGGRHDC